MVGVIKCGLVEIDKFEFLLILSVANRWVGRALLVGNDLLRNRGVWVLDDRGQLCLWAYLYRFMLIIKTIYFHFPISNSKRHRVIRLSTNTIELAFIHRSLISKRVLLPQLPITIHIILLWLLWRGLLIYRWQPMIFL